MAESLYGQTNLLITAARVISVSSIAPCGEEGINHRTGGHLGHHRDGMWGGGWAAGRRGRGLRLMPLSLQKRGG